MKLSRENKVWLTQATRALGASEEAVLNLLLDRLRTEGGIPQGNLIEWLEGSKKMTLELNKVLEEISQTRSALEETIRATSVYLMQSNMRNQPNPTKTGGAQ